MSKILVTGATGTIGSQLVKQLQAAKADFAVMVRDAAHAPAGVPARVADWEDVPALTAAMRGFDTVFLLFPLVPNKVQLAKNAAAAAKAAGVKHIVRSSGAGADASSSFALPKLQGTIDQVLADTGIATTFLRNAGFMQNYITFMADQIKSGTFYAANGDAAQSLIDIRDIVAVAAKILQSPAPHAGKAYTLTGGEAFTSAQAAQQLSAAIGKPVSYVAVTPEQAVEAMKGMHYPPFIVEHMDSLNRIVIAGYAAGIRSDVQTLLGRKPIGFAQFVQDYASAWK
jgi:uncharacterized protein YbjT (DUF2867 family)